jgi:hypothetical protein
MVGFKASVYVLTPISSTGFKTNIETILLIYIDLTMVIILNTMNMFSKKIQELIKR